MKILETFNNECGFAAKCIDSGNWIEGWYVCKRVPLTEPCHEIYEDLRSYNIDVNTLCRSTHLKDNHSYTVFEGHIVCKSDDSGLEPWIYTVCYDNELARFFLKPKQSRTIKELSMRKVSGMRIIGHVYHDPQIWREV